MKDLHSSVSEEMKGLHTSMDQLLDFVKSIKNERQGGVEETGRRKEEDEEHN